MKKIILCIVYLFFVSSIFAQSTDKISQLVSTENFFAALAKEKGIKKAFLTVSDANTIIFRPDPVEPEKFFKNKPADSGLLWWEPVYARISKSGDWGFTSGPYTYKESESSPEIYYGEYLSIWKKNQKGVWKLAVDLGIPHPKPLNTPKMVFTNPANERFFAQYSLIRQKQREELIFSSDKLFASTLSADNALAHKIFLAEECRLLFPGSEPVIGKEAVTEFWKKQNIKLTSQPVKADRSYSGELAFSYGNASIDKKGLNKLYNYVRIWEMQPGFEWNIILEIYIESEKQ